MKLDIEEAKYTDSGKVKVDKYIYDELKRIVNLKPWHMREALGKFFDSLSPFEQRTGQQKLDD